MLESEPMTVVEEEPQIIGEPLDKIQGIVRCIFCKDEPTQTAEEVIACKLLECCHTVCGPCIDAWPDDKKRDCPVCGLELNKLFLEHKILQEMVILPAPPVSENSTCEMHGSPCEHYCVECGDYVCEVCIESHKQLKMTQNHTIKHRNHCLPTTKEDKPFGKFPCPKHQIEQMAIYCITCNRLTCRDCQLGDHKDHVYKFVKDMVQENKVVLLKMFLQTKYSWTLMEQAVNILEDRKVDLHEQKVRIRTEIAELGSRLHKAVDTGMSRLNRNLDTQCGKITAHMDRQVHSLHKNMAPFEHTANFIEVILRRSTDTSVVYSQKFIRRHVEQITANKQLTVPNPASSEKIEFEHNISTLIEALEKMGTIQINKEAPVPAFAQIQTEVQKAIRNPNSEFVAFNSNDNGERAFTHMVRTALQSKVAEEANTLQPAAETGPTRMHVVENLAELDARPAQIHVATNLMDMDSRQGQIHVATNLMDTDVRPLQQNDPKQASWHTPQLPAASSNNETSTDLQMAEVLQSINVPFVEQMLRQAEREDGQGNAGVIQNAASSVPSEPCLPTPPPPPPPPPQLPQQASIVDGNSASVLHSTSPLGPLPPESSLATSYGQQSFSVMNSGVSRLQLVGSSQSLIQHQQQILPSLNPSLPPLNRVGQPGLPGLNSLGMPYTTQHSSIMSTYTALDQSLNQALRGAGTSSLCNSLFSNIDGHPQ